VTGPSIGSDDERRPFVSVAREFSVILPKVFRFR
jgi:hypothetical protein